MSIVNTSFAVTVSGDDVRVPTEPVVPEDVPADSVGFEENTDVPFCLIVKVSGVVPSEPFTTMRHWLTVPL
jgi:hypothetical protein